MARTEVVGVRLTQAQRHRLDALARATGRSRSGFLRRLLEVATIETPEIRLDGLTRRGDSH